MKLMFASDIHGSRSACEAVLAAYKAEGAERLVLLGDLLYHGPRNNLPDEYDPKGVIALLNGVKTGNLPDGLENKVTADGNRIDELCTIGS